MNKEIGAVCIFTLSLMVFSSFTPFAYALGEKTGAADKTLNFMLTKQVAPNCDGDVWIDEMDWDEYQMLRNQEVQIIDGWGDREAGEREEAYREMGVGTNPDVVDTKHIFIPGADDKPAVLFDVLRNKAVDPDTVCSLDNLFSRGRISYATRLNQDIRYCPDTELGRVPCELHATSEEVTELLKGVEDIGKEETEETESPKEEISDEQIENLMKALEKSPPDSIVETKDAQMTINADENKFFFKTQADFLHMILKLAPLDAFIETTNTVGMALGLTAVAQQGVRYFGSRVVRSVGPQLTERTSLRLLAREMGEQNILVKKFESLKGLIKEKKITDAGELVGKKGQKNLAAVSGEIKQIEASAVKQYEKSGIKIPKEINSATPDEVSKYAKIAKNQEEIKSATKLESRFSKPDDFDALVNFLDANGKKVSTMPGSNVYEKAFNALEELRKTAGGRKALSIYGDNLELISKTKKFTVEAGKITEETAAEGVQPTFSALKDVLDYKPVNSWSYNVGASYFNEARSLWRLSQKTGAIQTALRGFLSSKWFRVPFLVTQTSQSLFMGALWIRNVMYATPFVEAQGVLQFSLNSEDANYVIKKYELPHYIDIRKTVGNKDLKKFLGEQLNRLFAIVPFYEPEAKNAMQQKVGNIQDIVLILDQDVLASNLGNTKAINSITPSGDNWKFFSKFSDDTRIYNFEHPIGYSPSGKSALLLNLRNVNIYGISGMPNEWFTSPIDSVLPGLRALRDAAGWMSLFGMLPAGVSVVGTRAGVLVGIGTYFLGPALGISLSRLDDIWSGELVNVRQEISEETLCKNKVSEGRIEGIEKLRWFRAATAVCSAVTAPFIASPLFFISLACDGLQFGAQMWETNALHDITQDLQNCYETDFEVISSKDILAPDELKTQSEDMFGELEKQALDIFNIFSGDIKKQFDQFNNDMRIQAMNILGDVEDSTTITTGKELYYVHFYSGADIRWFQDQGCSIDLCQKTKDGYKCITQNGYWLMCWNSNTQRAEPCLKGVPSSLSLRINLDEGYASLIQRVVEVKKKEDAPFLEIYSDKVVPADACYNEGLVNLTGTKNLAEETREKIVNEILGDLDVIEVEDARIWFDKNDVAVQFINDKTCTNDMEFSAGDIFRFTGGHIKLYRDTDGKIEIIGSDGQSKCDFSLGAGAIGFSNGLIRSGFAQTKDGHTADYSNVYHVFIYSLRELDGSLVNDYDLEECILPDGTKGFRPKITTDDPEEDEQWNTLFGQMCMVDVVGALNSSARFYDNSVNFTDPTGLTKQYSILGFDPLCSDPFTGYVGPGYRIKSGDEPEACLYLQVGANGQPLMVADGQAPLPLLWANGLGGSWMWNSDSGRISIKNEFPIALTPAFNLYGGGGLSFVTPGMPPHGARASGEAVSAAGAGGVGDMLAALPWTPEGLELLLFIITLAGGLIFIRIRFRKEKGT